MKINPRTITYVTAVAEEQSFSKAAERLYITQPSLSQHILNAEKEYGVQFFDRRSMPVRLTYAGERFLAIAKEMDQLDRQLSREMDDITCNLTGRIAVGVSSTRGSRFIPQLFSRFKSRYPGFELDLVEDSNAKQLEAVRNGRVDFAFTGYTQDDLYSHLIAEREIKLAVRRDLVNNLSPETGSVAMTSFSEYPFILLKKGRGIRNIADQLFSDNNINPQIAYETSNYNMALGMAREGLGCTFVIDHEIPLPDGLNAYSILDCKEKYQLYIVYRKDTYLSLPFQYFIQLAREMDQ